MTADEYDTGEVTSPSARSGAVGGGAGPARDAPRDDRIGDADDGSDTAPRTAVETASGDSEERLYV